MPSAASSASPRPRWLLLSLAVPLAVAGLGAPVQAQKVVPKLRDMCPLGYVDLFNGQCSTLGATTYAVTPTSGEACPSGWMNVGGGYCRRK
ncbi:hypothetical protein KQ304_11965 [Synechococcus sp. CS-1329]|jgi:hypothetical protein|uniref:hypothetical protein n=1 Tax=Synechococcus sp. CS-1329 TaxID=2847975 RepID=UPI00223BA4EB|nr:hypothetical protein [Synechococcus sp. CS-1329]MCT0219698.1 hypothetical protein [Synechococcus sp. CS-1329]